MDDHLAIPPLTTHANASAAASQVLPQDRRSGPNDIEEDLQNTERVLSEISLAKIVAHRVVREISAHGSLREQEANSLESVYGHVLTELYCALGALLPKESFEAIVAFVDDYNGIERMLAIVFVVESASPFHPDMLRILAEHTERLAIAEPDSMIDTDSIRRDIGRIADQLENVLTALVP